MALSVAILPSRNSMLAASRATKRRSLRNMDGAFVEVSPCCVNCCMSSKPANTDSGTISAVCVPERTTSSRSGLRCMKASSACGDEATCGDSMRSRHCRCRSVAVASATREECVADVGRPCVSRSSRRCRRFGKSCSIAEIASGCGAVQSVRSRAVRACLLLQSQLEQIAACSIDRLSNRGATLMSEASRPLLAGAMSTGAEVAGAPLGGAEDNDGGDADKVQVDSAPASTEQALLLLLAIATQDGCKQSRNCWSRGKKNSASDPCRLSSPLPNGSTTEADAHRMARMLGSTQHVWTLSQAAWRHSRSKAR
jgi:hypothetical protein